MFDHFSVRIVRFSSEAPPDDSSAEEGIFMKWTVNRKVARVVMICASLAAFVVASGAGTRWG